MASRTVSTTIKLFLCCALAAAGLGLSVSQAAGGPEADTLAAAAAKPDQTKPDQTKPDQSKPDRAKPDQAKTTMAKAESPAPVAVKPGQAAAHASTEPPMDDPMSPEARANVRKYCMNIAPAATDARFAWQSKQLQEIEARVKSRVAELEAKEGEVKDWFDRRDAIAKEAKQHLVGIYAKMKPEDAALQIAALDDDMAAALLSALPPNKASAIFSNITPPERAAKLAGLLANPTASAADKKL